MSTIPLSFSSPSLAAVAAAATSRYFLHSTSTLSSTECSRVLRWLSEYADAANLLLSPWADLLRSLKWEFRGPTFQASYQGPVSIKMQICQAHTASKGQLAASMNVINYFLIAERNRLSKERTFNVVRLVTIDSLDFLWRDNRNFIRCNSYDLWASSTWRMIKVRTYWIREFRQWDEERDVIRG